MFKEFSGSCDTALVPAWSLAEYLRWQREQEERDEAAREAANIKVLARFDPECEAAVRALEQGGWGCQAGLGTR
jgi:hypothetical protein